VLIFDGRNTNSPTAAIPPVGGKHKNTIKMKIQFKKDDYSNFTTEDLIKKKKVTTMVTGFLAGLLTVLLIMATLITIEQGETGIGLIVVALGLSPILFINYSSVKTINEELKSRNLS
jgi:hypothetical protein